MTLGTNNWDIETYKNKVGKYNQIFIKSTTPIISIDSIVVLNWYKIHLTTLGGP